MSKQTSLDIFRSGERTPGEPLCGWDKWVEWCCPRRGFHAWGLEIEGIPLEHGIVSCEGCPPLPIVRRPMREELEGLKKGARRRGYEYCEENHQTR